MKSTFPFFLAILRAYKQSLIRRKTPKNQAEIDFVFHFKGLEDIYVGQFSFSEATQPWRMQVDLSCEEWIAYSPNGREDTQSITITKEDDQITMSDSSTKMIGTFKDGIITGKVIQEGKDDGGTFEFKDVNKEAEPIKEFEGVYFFLFKIENKNEDFCHQQLDSFILISLKISKFF